MKRFTAILCVLVLLLGASACGRSEELTLENEQLRQELEQTQTDLEQAQAQLESAGTDKAALEDELAAALEEYAELEENFGLKEDIIDALNAQIEKYKSASRWWSDMVYSTEKDMDGAILRSEELWGIVYLEPWEAERYKSTAKDIYVEVVMKVLVTEGMHGDSREWYLVRFEDIGEPGVPFTDFGWVPAESLEEYTYENMKEIVGPIYLREGAVIYDDEALTVVSQYPPTNPGAVSVSDLGNGVCMIGVAGYGVPFYVRASDVIYPAP